MKLRSGPVVAFYLLIVFLSGVVVGAFGHYLYNAKTVGASTETKRFKSYRERYLHDMEMRLKLDARQKEQLIKILDAFKPRFDAVRQKMDPEWRAILEDQRKQIREILRPDQQQEYEKMVHEKDRKQFP
ncbi:MAG: hypothetical protein NZV14_16885 [Bryobacteraceae bacterium]|nr:hypothetical protein [Bryobacteraceae bacterium]MDW8379838.1 hypothetical protein [Bryobacterales bacterium]